MPDGESQVTKYKGYEFKQVMRLLPLALAPGPGKTILDWRPFADGDTLDSIIEAHNDKCIEAYKTTWMHDYIERLVQIIVVVKSDLSTVERLDVEGFKDVRVLLADLDSMEGRDRLLDEIKTKITIYSTLYTFYLGQVGKVKGAKSLRERFSPLPFVRKGTEVFSDEKELKRFLAELCDYPYVEDAPEPPPPDGDPLIERANAAYVERLPKVADKFRDAAMGEMLSTEEAKTLARAEATQELFLARVAEQARPEPDYAVAVSSVRKAITGNLLELYSQEPEIQPVELVEINPTRSLGDLTPEQRGLMGELGIWNDASAAVHFNQSSVRQAVSALGDAIEATTFCRNCPIGNNQSRVHLRKQNTTPP